jgi:hypothetical protein
MPGGVYSWSLVLALWGFYERGMGACHWALQTHVRMAIMRRLIEKFNRIFAPKGELLRVFLTSPKQTINRFSFLQTLIEFFDP